MPVYKVAFSFTRTVVAHIEAEDESAIDEFLEDNPEWDVRDNTLGLIDSDETGDDCVYSIEKVEGVTALAEIIGGNLVEAES